MRALPRQLEARAGPGLGWKDRVSLFLVFLAVVPVVLVLFLGAGGGSPLLIAVVTGIGIVAAGYSLAWGVEALQFVISEVLALAVLAVVQVLPEYSIEAVLSYHGALDPSVLQYATASMTGANRLLLGVGWPLVAIVSYLAARKRGEGAVSFVQLDRHQSIEVFFLAAATLYSFVIVLRDQLSVVDGAALIAIYGLYLYAARKMPARETEELEDAEGPTLAVASLRGALRGGAILALIALGGFMILVGSDPFVHSILQIGAELNVSQYLLIQWIAPFLTELPEGITAVYWATRARLAPMAIANLISSKVNQWTLLLATIPVVYSVTLAGFHPITLGGVQREEIFITAAQSIYGVACLLDLRLELRESALLLSLFLVQFFVPFLRLETGVLYLALAAIELARTRKRIRVFSDFWEIISGKGDVDAPKP